MAWRGPARPPATAGGRFAASISTRAFLFSGLSFYMSALQRADLKVFVPPVLQHAATAAATSTFLRSRSPFPTTAPTPARCWPWNSSSIQTRPAHARPSTARTWASTHAQQKQRVSRSRRAPARAPACRCVLRMSDTVPSSSLRRSLITVVPADIAAAAPPMRIAPHDSFIIWPVFRPAGRGE